MVKKSESPAARTDAVPTPPRSFAPQARLALIGIGIAAVLAAGAFGFLALADGGAAVAPLATAPTAPTSETPAPTALDRKYVPNHTFESESGNLRCSVGTFSGEPGAICQQVNINYAVPSGVCPGNTEGVFVGVGPSGAYWPCVSQWREPTEVVGYDTPITQSGVTCSINYETGVTCTNEDGAGFTMEYDAGVTTF